MAYSVPSKKWTNKAKYDVQFGAPGVGRIKYVDADGNGIINTNDRVWLGSDNPKVIGGLNLGASWKGFDLMFL